MAVTWDQIALETKTDPILSKIIIYLSEGPSPSSCFTPEFKRYKDALYTFDGALMYKDCVVVPTQLRSLVLRNLHAAHQGVSSMEQRAQSIIFWPGMTYDIHKTRARCEICNRNAPSIPALPSEPANPPHRPPPLNKCSPITSTLVGHITLL